MRITEGQLRRITNETMSDEFRARLLARKKYYDELAKKPLPYDVGDIITVGKSWTGTSHGIPVIIEPGTNLNVLKLRSTTDGDYTLTVPTTLQVPNSAVTMMGLTYDTIEVEPGEIIRIQGAQLRNTQMDLPGGWELIRETANGIPWQEQEFGDARGTWRVGDLYDYASNRYDLQQIPVSDLEENNLNDVGHKTSDKSKKAYIKRAMESNLDYPIIVVNYPDGLWIADGTHRTWKARELGEPYMQGWILDWEEIMDIPHGPPSAESASSPY